MSNLPGSGLAGAASRSNIPSPGYKSSRLRKFLRLSWILSLGLFITASMALVLFAEKTSRIDASDFLHEPLFWLVPVSYLLLFLAIVLAIADLFLEFRKGRQG